MSQNLVSYNNITEISGDILKVRVPDTMDAPVTCNGELALVEDAGNQSLAQVIRLEGETVSLQVFRGTKGISSQAEVRFLGKFMDTIFSGNIFGRIFNGAGVPIDAGANLDSDPRTPIGTPTVNPVRRILPTRMVRTDIPMIDMFNTLVESQKMPIFSVAGEPFNQLMARIAVNTDADVVVFGGIGLIFDDYHYFKQTFEDAGVFGRTVMFVHQASDPVVEAVLVPDMALAVAEKLATEENKRVLVLLTDMTAFADALKEIGVSLERIPANRGYMGDLYSQLARRYEKACQYKGAGSVTLLTVTTMPGNDVTHPIPDNTGYITEGQFYLHGGVIDPFGSLSRLKQFVVGDRTREDHGALMNTMIRLYSGARDAEQKKAMAFELTDYDHRLLRYGELFKSRFMDINVAMPLEQCLDLAWQTLAECFEPDELLMKENLIKMYFPKDVKKAA
ncbi:MAG: V-type ATP synthase subunit B [Alphaproteobacteria bacterium]|nr:V-type ATP synthase subunit B [Alphaproteobacteria bacterium]